MSDLNTVVLHVVDAIIEREGACGMAFGGIDFEARGKCNNDRSYPKLSRVSDWTEEDCISILQDVVAYLDPCDHDSVENYDVGLAYGAPSHVVRSCKKCLVIDPYVKENKP
jgi:hypothetical protein